ncbi:MAG: glycosyl transferase family 1, partial [Proteobacteria bacterium]|nr:glycosyl transferase family 1 [Pseudomonadota bacterium]
MTEATPHLCLLGDANSPHARRWAGEMLARGWRVSLVTARPEQLDGVEQRVLPPVRRSTDWLLRAGAARRHVQELAPDIVHAHYITS